MYGKAIVVSGLSLSRESLDNNLIVGERGKMVNYCKGVKCLNEAQAELCNEPRILSPILI